MAEPERHEFTEDIISNQLQTLRDYLMRFYNRQFMSRAKADTIQE